MSARPRPAPKRHSASVATLASFSSRTSRPSRAAKRSRSGTSRQPARVGAWCTTPAAASSGPGEPTPRPATVTSGRVTLTRPTRAAIWPTTAAGPAAARVASSACARTAPSAATIAARSAVPPRSTPIAAAATGRPPLGRPVRRRRQRAEPRDPLGQRGRPEGERAHDHGVGAGGAQARHGGLPDPAVRRQHDLALAPDLAQERPGPAEARAGVVREALALHADGGAEEGEEVDALQGRTRDLDRGLEPQHDAGA